MNLTKLFFLPFLQIVALPLWGQVGEIPSPSDRPIEFSIPISPAFDMLGANPSEVMKPSAIKDMKVDWSFQSWRLKPNLAFQIQPIWELFYNRADLTKYQQASPLMRMLSSLDFSAGTIEDDLLRRHVAVAVKMTVFQQKDPLNEPGLYTRITREYYEQKNYLEQTIKMLQDTLPKMVGKPELLEETNAFRAQLRDAQSQISLLERNQKERIAHLATLYVQENWNAAFVDVAVGKSFSFENSNLDSLNLIGEGLSLWVNGSLGVGRKGLVTGIVKYAALELNQIRSNEWLIGVNGRYGSPKFNFFVELALRDNDVADPIITIAYGGDWRINRNIMLSYGVRTVYDDNFSFRRLIPVASLSCMMR